MLPSCYALVTLSKKATQQQYAIRLLSPWHGCVAWLDVLPPDRTLWQANSNSTSMSDDAAAVMQPISAYHIKSLLHLL